MKNNNNKNRYTTIVDNKIEFSYNLIDINNFSINKLKCMKSKVAEEFIKLKINIYK